MDSEQDLTTSTFAHTRRKVAEDGVNNHPLKCGHGQITTHKYLKQKMYWGCVIIIDNHQQNRICQYMSAI